MDAPRRRRAGDRTIFVTGLLRLAAIAALLLAVGSPGIPLPSRDRGIVIILDTSAAMDQASLERARSAASRLIEGLGKGDRIALLAAGPEPRLLGGPWSQAEAAAALRSLRLPSPAGASDLPSALSAGAKLLRSERLASGLLVVIGAFRTSPGDPATEAALTEGLPVIALPLGPAPSGARSLGIAAPRSARRDEKVAVSWILESDGSKEINWELLVDDRPTRSGTARLGRGRTTIDTSIDSGDAGSRHLRFRALDGRGGTIPGLESGAVLEVAGGATILVVSADGKPSPISGALRIQGLETRNIAPPDLPGSAISFGGLSALVLDDIPALALSSSQQAAIAAFASAGGGVLFVGGPSSFGRGEYYATPLEDMLPVHTDTRQRLFHTRARLLFIIDHSGSMSQKIGGESKQEAAMRGVAAALKELEPYDEVGILSFDSSPTWVLPFTPAGKIADVSKAVANIPEGGGTDLPSAIEAGLAGFGEPGPTKRHMIVLTDGFTSQTDWQALVSRLIAADVSLSTIAIGDTVNEDLLSGLAAAAGGAYWRAEGTRIPAVIDQETLRLTRDLMREGLFPVEATRGGGPIEGLSHLPAVRGYLLSTPKALATVWLKVGPTAGEEAGDPLFASWRWGAGEVAAFLSDSGARWLAPWRPFPEYNRLWAQALRFIEAPAPRGDLRAQAEVRGEVARIEVEARAADGSSRSGLGIIATDVGDGGQWAMTEGAPGHYSVDIPLRAAGLHRFSLRSHEGSATGASVWYAPFAELTGLGPDLPAASALARATKGLVLDEAGAVAPPARAGFRWIPGRPWFALLAVLILLVELWLRSALSGQIAAARQTLASWLGRSSGEADAMLRTTYMGVAPVGREAKHGRE